MQSRAPVDNFMKWDESRFGDPIMGKEFLIGPEWTVTGDIPDEIWKLLSTFRGRWIDVEDPRVSVPVDGTLMIHKWMDIPLWDRKAFHDAVLIVVDSTSTHGVLDRYGTGTRYRIPIDQWSNALRPLTPQEIAIMMGTRAVDLDPHQFNGEGCPFCMAGDSEVDHYGLEMETLLEARRHSRCRTCEMVWDLHFQAWDITWQDANGDAHELLVDDTRERDNAVKLLMDAARTMAGSLGDRMSCTPSTREELEEAIQTCLNLNIGE